MSGDYVPHSEIKLLPWLERFVSFTTDHAAEIGLSPEELAELQTNLQTYAAAHRRKMAAQTAARAACSAKDDARKNILPGVRSVAMRMQSLSSIRDSDRAGLGLTCGDPNGHTPIHLSDERPTAVIDISQRLVHIIRVFNETPTGTTRARPANAYGCEVWNKVGEAPTGPNGLRYVGTARGVPLVVRYEARDCGKQAYYMLRWVGGRGKKGNWSQTESATIAA